MTCQLDVLCIDALPGQRLAVSGAHPSLGAWDPSRAVTLTSSPEGLWTGAVPRQDVNAKFKLMILNTDGSLAAWEPLKHSRKWPAEAMVAGARLRTKYGRKRMKVDQGRTAGWLESLTTLLGCCLAPESDPRHEMDLGPPLPNPPQSSHARAPVTSASLATDEDDRELAAMREAAEAAKGVRAGKAEQRQAAPQQQPSSAMPPAATPSAPAKAVAPKAPPSPPAAVAPLRAGVAPPAPVQPGGGAALPGQVSEPAPTAVTPPPAQRQPAPAPASAPLPKAPAPPVSVPPEVVAPAAREASPPSAEAPPTAAAAAKEAAAEAPPPPPAGPPAVVEAAREVEVPPPSAEGAPEKAEAEAAAETPEAEALAAKLGPAAAREAEQPWFLKPSVASWLQPRCINQRQPVTSSSEEAGEAEPLCMTKPSAPEEETAAGPPPRSRSEWARLPSVATWMTARFPPSAPTPDGEDLKAKLSDDLLGLEGPAPGKLMDEPLGMSLGLGAADMLE